MISDETFEIVFRFEGGYVNDPDDSGGPTKYGVTQDTYNTFRKKWKYSLQHVRYITKQEAKQIYDSYWRDSRAEEISRTHPRAAAIHFDFAINAGYVQAGKSLQRCLGNLKLDGIIGPRTLAALALVKDEDLVKAYSEERRRFYKSLVVRKPVKQKFLKGWLLRTDKLERIVSEPGYGSK